MSCIRSLIVVQACAGIAAQAAPFAYVPNEKSGSVSVIDTAAGTRTGDIAVGQLPWGVVIR
jgi:YVTN family beta-propeller protein